MERGIKAIIYGVPGVGKTTLAAQFPAPYILDLEHGAERYNVPCNSDIETFQIFKQVLKNIPEGTRTLVIDTFDELEKMIVYYIMSRENVDSLNKVGGGYGRGWLAVYEEFGRVINDLEAIRIKRGINIVLNGHSAIRHFEPPDSVGYERYTFATYEKNKEMLIRWADIILFARFDSIVVENGDSAKVKSNGKRVMYTVTNPCWEAKSRWKLPEKVPMEFAAIASIFPVADETAPQAPQEPPKATPPSNDTPEPPTAPETATASSADTVPGSAPAREPVTANPNAELVQNIRTLCNVSHLDEEKLLAYITKHGVVPAGMKLDNLAAPVLKRIENGFDAIYKNIKNGY
jgi:hypothetical protein